MRFLIGIDIHYLVYLVYIKKKITEYAQNNIILHLTIIDTITEILKFFFKLQINQKLNKKD